MRLLQTTHTFVYLMCFMKILHSYLVSYIQWFFSYIYCNCRNVLAHWCVSWLETLPFELKTEWLLRLILIFEIKRSVIPEFSHWLLTVQIEFKRQKRATKVHVKRKLAIHFTTYYWSDFNSQLNLHLANNFPGSIEVLMLG